MSALNILELSARDLDINWGDDPRFWRWLVLEDATSDGRRVEVAELLGLSWFQIDGKFDMSLTAPGVAYEVVLVVMLKEGSSSYGWDAPVTLGLSVCGGERVQQHEESLKDREKGEWMELLVGELQWPREEASGGEVHFFLLGYGGGLWKGGILVKGAVVRPKYSSDWSDIVIH